MDAVVVDDLEVVNVLLLIGADVIFSVGGVFFKYGEENRLLGVKFGLDLVGVSDVVVLVFC